MAKHAFKGFPKESLDFLKTLKKHNNRDWFAQNKEFYKTHVESPAQDFLALMNEKLAPLAGKKVQGKIFRIHRDVRFSKDKTPYNTHVHILWSTQASKEEQDDFPGFFFALNLDKVVFGLGSFRFSKTGLERYRKAVVHPTKGPALEKILQQRLKQGWRLNQPPLKRVPAGFDADHPRSELLKRKGFALWLDLPVDVALNTKLPQNFLKELTKLMPLYKWLAKI